MSFASEMLTIERDGAVGALERAVRARAVPLDVVQHLPAAQAALAQGCANCNCLGDCMTPFHLSSLVLLLHCSLCLS